MTACLFYQMISYSWIYTNPLVRHSRRRFSNFVGGGGRQRAGRQMFNAPKTMQHKAIQPHTVTDESKADEKSSSSCCFSNSVRTCNISFSLFRAYSVFYLQYFEAVYLTEHALTQLMICRVEFSCETKILFSLPFHRQKNRHDEKIATERKKSSVETAAIKVSSLKIQAFFLI